MRNSTAEYVRRGYVSGYQNALQEIIEIAESEGFDAALRYARDNYQSSAVTACAAPGGLAGTQPTRGKT